MNVHPRFLLFARLSDDDLEHIGSFDCADEEMNRFFKEECYDEQKRGLNATYVLYYKGELAAFCSICTDKINLASSEQTEMSLPRGSVPTIKVARLGRAVKFRSHGFGTFILEYVRLQVLEISESVGVRFLTLDAYQHREAYYETLGFKRNQNQGKNSTTISMRLDIFEDDGDSNEE